MTYLYLRNNQVVMYGTNQISAPTLTEIQLSLTQDELDNLALNCPATYNGVGLDFAGATVAAGPKDTIAQDLVDKMSVLQDKTYTTDDLKTIFDIIG